jgi:hypothetical protein
VEQVVGHATTTSGKRSRSDQRPRVHGAPDGFHCRIRQLGPDSWRANRPDLVGEPQAWADTDLDLTGANLIDFDLNRCTTRVARFGWATFTGPADFGLAAFTHGVPPEVARFVPPAE